MQQTRTLRADEIECRVAKITSSGCQLLLYKDARCDKRILDELYGPMNWQDRYEEIKGNMYCSVGVRNSETGEWIWKQDCGTESFAEKEKGEASDAFKRACFNWGIGRELYSKIFIWLKVATEPDERDKSKYKLKDKFAKFYVSYIETDAEREKITKLEISDKDGVVVFTYNEKSPAKKATKATKGKKQDQNVDVEKAIRQYINQNYFDNKAGLLDLKCVLSERGKIQITEIEPEELPEIFEQMDLRRK